MLAPTVKIVRKGDARKALARVGKALAGPSHVKVGFPSGTGSDIIMRAVWNEFGTAGGASGGGWGGPVPERPFFRNAMRDGVDGYRKIAKSDAPKVLRGDMMMTTSLSRLGLKGQGDIQKSIGSNIPPPNAPLTVALKGSSATLIDTGEMRQRVTFLVED